jgi:hypothetical protein
MSVAAFVLASIALFVALSGGAVAAGIVPLARHAVTAGTASNAMKFGGKTPAQLRAAWLGNSSKQGVPGPQGPKGDTGARGPAGPAGPAGSSSLSVHASAYSLAVGGTPGEKGLFTVSCGAGQKAVSGGYDADGTVLALMTHPTAADDGWQIYLDNADAGAAHSGTVYVVCQG